MDRGGERDGQGERDRQGERDGQSGIDRRRGEPQEDPLTKQYFCMELPIMSE